MVLEEETLENHIKYVEGLVKKAKAAQKTLEQYSQQKVDELCGAIAYAMTRPETAREMAESLAKESNMGRVEDKINKVYAKVKGCYRDMKNEKSVGLIEVDENTGVSVYAKPMGVIGAIIPVTNGEATPVVKSLMAIKGRNAVILAPHPSAVESNWMITEKIREVLKKFGAPEDLVQAIAPGNVSIETSGELMKQVDFVLATGGTPMVRAAYSSGTPTIGVGTGNVVSIVDGTTEMDDVAKLILRSKTFDNATSCSTENNIIVFEQYYPQFIKAMESNGAFLIREGTKEKDKLQKTLWPNNPLDHVLNKNIVGKSALEIAELAGLTVPDNTLLLLVEENDGFGDEFPFNGEKLSPVSSVKRCKDFDDAIDLLDKILNYQGLGHSCGIHTSNDERIHKLADHVKVTKVVVNQPQSLSNSGSWTNGFPNTMTVGCGTWGHNSVSHNVTWKDLLNFTRVARVIPSTQPEDNELFDEHIRKAFQA